MEIKYKDMTSEALAKHFRQEIPVESMMVFENGRVRPFNDPEMRMLNIQVVDAELDGSEGLKILEGYGPHKGHVRIICD